MKRIIDGQTYNTDTSTLVARSWWLDWEKGNAEIQSDLYLTRGGAFFIVHTEPGNEEARAVFDPMARDAVDDWITKGEVEVFDTSILGEPEEAGAEREPEATIYVRIPRSLKERIEAKARGDGVSLNAWVMRCAERCSTSQAADALGVAHYIATSVNAVPDGYSEQQCYKALQDIADEIERAWSYLGLPREKGVELREDVILYSCKAAQDANITRDWQPYQDESSAA